MLVLSRKTGESVVIDGGITVTVLKVEGRQVRIGIEAPQDFRVLRGELTAADALDAFGMTVRPLVAEACVGV